MKKALAWLVKIKDRLLKRPISSRLTVEELNLAELLIIKHVQSSHFSSELTSLGIKDSARRGSKLYDLRPMIDDDDILVVHGRLRHADSPYNLRHPVILPHDHPVAT